MSKYKLSIQARDDLKEIYQYTQLNFGINQAKKYLSKITDVLNALSDKILTGRDASLFAHGLRKIEVGSHLVFYRACKQFCVSALINNHLSDFQILSQNDSKQASSCEWA